MRPVPVSSCCLAAGLSVHFLTLPGHFKNPFVRDWILLHGKGRSARIHCHSIAGALGVLVRACAGPRTFQPVRPQACWTPAGLPANALLPSELSPAHAAPWQRTPPPDCLAERGCMTDTQATGGMVAGRQVAGRRGTGRCIAMAVGGARESLFVEPGTMNIILDRRLVTVSPSFPPVSTWSCPCLGAWRGHCHRLH